MYMYVKKNIYLYVCKYICIYIYETRYMVYS